MVKFLRIQYELGNITKEQVTLLFNKGIITEEEIKQIFREVTE